MAAPLDDHSDPRASAAWWVAGSGALRDAVAGAFGGGVRVERVERDAVERVLAAEAPGHLDGLVVEAGAVAGWTGAAWRPLEGSGCARPALVVAAGPAQAGAARGADAWLPWPAPEPAVRAVLAAAAARARLAAERRRLVALALAMRPAALAPAVAGRLAEAPDATVWARGATAEARLAWSLALHRGGPRAGGPFAAVDASELTDVAAVHAAWNGALGGTLHLEGPAELAPVLQRELARRLAERPARTDDGLRPGVRLVAADGGAGEGELVPELAYRLNVLCVPVDAAAAGPGADAPPDRLDDLERWQVERVLASCGGNRSEAARRLGLHRATLHAKLRRWQAAP